MSTFTARPGTPPPASPLMIFPNNFREYLRYNEIPVIDGPLAPPRGNIEIRKCINCKQVNLLVHNTSTKEMCGVCTHSIANTKINNISTKEKNINFN